MRIARYVRTHIMSFGRRRLPSSGPSSLLSSVLSHPRRGCIANTSSPIRIGTDLHLTKLPSHRSISEFAQSSRGCTRGFSSFGETRLVVVASSFTDSEISQTSNLKQLVIHQEAVHAQIFAQHSLF